MSTYDHASTVIVALPLLMGALYHRRTNLPTYKPENLPSAIFYLDALHSVLGDFVVTQGTASHTSKTGWTTCNFYGKKICIVCLWFVLVFGVGPVHPIADGLLLTAGGDTFKMEMSLECDSLSIHFEGHPISDEHKLGRNELNSSVKHNKTNGMCE